MLQLTREADYGFRLMLEVAAHTEGAITTAQVARRQRMPYQFLRKVAQTLASCGLLVSERGVGLALARPAEAISLLDIVRAFESPGLNRCTVDPPRCDRREICAVYPVWVEAQRELERLLGSTRLSDVLRRQAALDRAAAKTGPRREEATPGGRRNGSR